MKVKKVLLILFIGFLLFWLFQDPSGMASSLERLASSIWDLLVGLFESLIDFFRAI